MHSLFDSLLMLPNLLSLLFSFILELSITPLQVMSGPFLFFPGSFDTFAFLLFEERLRYFSAPHHFGSLSEAVLIAIIIALFYFPKVVILHFKQFSSVFLCGL